MRLLVLAPFAPRLDASHGGGRAIGELVTELARRHHVALLYLRGEDEPAVDAAVHDACDLVREVPRRGERGIGHRAKIAAALVAGTPMWVAGWRTREMAATLRRSVVDWRPDIVQAEYHVMGQYLSLLPPFEIGATPRVIRQHEPGTAASYDGAAGRRGVERLVAGLDRRAWARYEARVMRDADAVVALTERDAAALRRLAPAARVECIPLATVPPKATLSPTGSGAPELLFVGNFVHAPNVDAATRLARHIFPKVRAANPAASLRIVGPDPDGRAGALAGEGVVVTGEVSEVWPFLDAAAVVIVPLRLGGGIRVKVIEALAGGKAVIASRLAVEGLAVRDGRQVVLADTDEEFAAAAVALLAEPDRRAHLAAAARAWAAVHLGWDRPAAAFDALYASLLSR